MAVRAIPLFCLAPTLSALLFYRYTIRMNSSLLDKVKDLPALPVVAMKVIELINDPNSSGSDIADVLKKDQALTTKVLRLVNSSYYSIPGGVSDVQRALGFLGFNTVAQLVLGISVVSMFKDETSESFSVTEFWKHALAVGMASETLAKKTKKAKAEEAFTCGLLHDIGKLVLKEVDPGLFMKLIEDARIRSISFLQVEVEEQSTPHMLLGETIAKRWALPKPIQWAIRYHHEDVKTKTEVADASRDLVRIVRFCNEWVGSLSLGHSGNFSPRSADVVKWKELGLSEEDLKTMTDQLIKDFEKSGALLSAFR